MIENQGRLNEIIKQGVDDFSTKNDLILNSQNILINQGELHRSKIQTNVRELERQNSLIRSGQVQSGILLAQLKSKIDENLKLLDIHNEKQLTVTDKMIEGQEQLNEMIKKAVDDFTTKNELILDQQKSAINEGELYRSKIQTNIRELDRQNSLIRSGQMQSGVFLTQMKGMIDENLKLFDLHTKKVKTSHSSLMDDVQKLKVAAEEISNQISKNMENVLNEANVSNERFQKALDHLDRINERVDALSNLLDKLQYDFEDKLALIMEKLAIYPIIWQHFHELSIHVGILLTGMLMLAFLDADRIVRAIFFLTVSGNLTALCFEMGTDILTMSKILAGLIVGYFTVLLGMKLKTLPINIGLSMNANDEIEKDTGTDGKENGEANDSDTSGYETTVNSDRRRRMKRSMTPFLRKR
jgi:hypothetical protein